MHSCDSRPWFTTSPRSTRRSCSRSFCGLVWPPRASIRVPAVQAPSSHVCRCALRRACYHARVFLWRAITMRWQLDALLASSWSLVKGEMGKRTARNAAVRDVKIDDRWQSLRGGTINATEIAGLYFCLGAAPTASLSADIAAAAAAAAGGAAVAAAPGTAVSAAAAGLRSDSDSSGTAGSEGAAPAAAAAAVAGPASAGRQRRACSSTRRRRSSPRLPAAAAASAP